MSSSWRSILCDSLEKVFPDTEPRPITTSIAQHVLRGETVAVQVAVHPPVSPRRLPSDLSVQVDLDRDDVTARVFAVDLVPATHLAFDDHDDHYLRDAPGLYPDLLRPLGEGELLRPFRAGWRSIWIDLTAAEEASAGPVRVGIRLTDTAGEAVVEEALTVEVVPATLPALPLVNTHWFHADGLAQYHRVPVWSEEHWDAIDQALAEAARTAVNSVLTPVWTPPLDTGVGLHRLPTQLLSVQVVDGGHQFGFERLRRWMEIARRHGIEHLEIAHLFSQWGARHAPAIYTDDGARLFGWETAATDPAYRDFLTALIPQLREVLAAEWGLERVIFHISDEPHGDQIESYRAAREVVADLLEGCTIVDALSDFEFWSTGEVPIPVVATDAAQPFLDAGVQPLWLYYCVSQNVDVANRFFSMPSTRNRVIGAQLFLTGAVGFLHWGFNFYNSQYSTHPIDPFRTPDADGGFPAGDPFLVYPGPGGAAWPSIRSRVFAEAMSDVQLMSLATERIGTEAVRAIVDPTGDLTLTHYPTDPDHYRRVRAGLVESL